MPTPHFATTPTEMDMETATISRGESDGIGSGYDSLGANVDDSKGIRYFIVDWLYKNTKISQEDLNKVYHFRETVEERAYLSDPERESPVDEVVKAMSKKDLLGHLEDYIKRNPASLQERREYLSCVSEWLGRHRRQHFFDKQVPPEGYVQSEAEIEADYHEDLKLQTSSLGFYVIAHRVLGWVVDYPGSRDILENIVQHSDQIKPLAKSFSSMRGRVREKKMAKMKVLAEDYVLPYEEYKSARDAVNALPHEVLWILKYVRPFLDLDGNTLFSTGCTYAIRKHYMDMMERAYRKEHNIAEGQELSERTMNHFRERAEKVYTTRSVIGLSKEFRAIFNTFCFFDE